MFDILSIKKHTKINIKMLRITYSEEVIYSTAFW